MTTHSTPTVSRVLADGSLVDLIFDAAAAQTALAVCRPEGDVAVVDQVTAPDGELLVPYAATNNLLTSECVLLPSALGNATNKAALLADIKSFIHHYVSLSPVFEDIAAHYILLSWVHDAFSEVPLLRLAGDYGSGKTRALLVLGSLTYKGFFASGASTVSPIFHVLHEFQATLLLDEADLKISDATVDLVKILNNGTVKGLPVLRTMTNRYRELNPQAFRVFGPKIVAMRQGFRDDALESRFLTEDMNACTLRADIPISIPDTLKVEAQALRNRLLAWRFAMRNMVAIDPTRVVKGLSARGNQMALPLLSLVDDAPLREAIGTRLAAEEARAVAKRVAIPHVAMTGVLDRLFRQSPNVPVSMAAEAFNAETGLALPIKSVGHIIRREVGVATTKTRGVYVVPASERAKVHELAERYSPPEQTPA